MKKLIFLYLICISIITNAEIPGFGVLHGKNNIFLYNEYNINPNKSKDQYFLNVFEYGLTDWISFAANTMNYTDHSLNFIGLGGAVLIYKHEYFNMRFGTFYMFDSYHANKKNNMYYYSNIHGKIYKNLSYLYRTLIRDFTNSDIKHNWKLQIYLMYAINTSLIPYISFTNEPEYFNSTIDYSIGFWSWIIKLNKNNFLKKCRLYFDVANLTENYNLIRLSIGFDIVF